MIPPGAFVEEFTRRFARSAELFGEAQSLLPGGLSHDSRNLDPFPVYVRRASGAHKWTVEGHRLIDYGMGHGALLLGHGHPLVLEAISQALPEGTHMSAPHPRELEWARRVQSLVPSAERVRFTASGTEATLLALRLARAHTGRPRVAKLEGHFHGWHDEALVGNRPPFDRVATAGSSASASAVDVLPADNLDAAEELLGSGRMAALVLEPSGASWGTVPLRIEYLRGLRGLCTATGTLLVFDEVITGFRFAPGGAQQHLGVIPDLTCLAKVLAGGLPGGAVAGRGEVLDLMSFRGSAAADGRRVTQYGTYNANPISAAAGVATLDLVADGRPQERAAELATRLRRGFNGALARRGVPGCAYGERSLFHVYVGPDCPIEVDGDGVPAGGWRAEPLLAGMPGLNALRRGLLVNGVDLLRSGGLVSAAHTEADIDETVAAFDHCLEMV